MQRAIIWFGAAVAIAALYTGFRSHFAVGSMHGFFWPHYGYSAYVESAALMLAGLSPIGWLCGTAILISDNRCAWLGVLAGVAYLSNKERRVALAIIGLLAVLLGAWIKPYHYNDSVRIQIWLEWLRIFWKYPLGIRAHYFRVMWAGKEVEKAHSDLLQLLVEFGIFKFTAATALIGFYLYTVLQEPPTKARAALVCLTVQSIFDNRLHRPVCAIIYVLIWLIVLTEHSTKHSSPPQVYNPQGHPVS